jgi:hypothetical protein
VVAQISGKYDGQELSSTIIACLFLYRLTSHLWDLYVRCTRLRIVCGVFVSD